MSLASCSIAYPTFNYFGLSNLKLEFIHFHHKREEGEQEEEEFEQEVVESV